MGVLSGLRDLLPRRKQHHVTAQLNQRLMPIARGQRYEDPLHEALATRKLGEVDGGGTMQEASGEISFIDVEIYLSDLEAGVPFVIAELESLGAPKGSLLRVDAKREIPFGKLEGLALYLDGANLPDEVYATSDVNVVIAELDKNVKGVGSFVSHWRGPTETALYLYGDSFDELRRRIAPFIDTYPLCKGARIVKIA